MMELREPPRPVTPPRRDRLVRWLLAIQLVVLAAIAVAVWRGGGRSGGDPGAAERLREVAAKLKAAGLEEEAATIYGEYLAAGTAAPGERARIAYTLGVGYLERGRYEQALRWLYEAEAWDDGSLEAELGAKTVRALELAGRHFAAQAILDRRSGLEGEAARRPQDDPVLARIGEREIRRSELDRALADLPPEMARQVSGVEGRREFLRRYVADELLWRKAQKLEYDDDPEVRRRHAELLKQLAVGRFVEREVVSRIEIDPVDLESFFAANRQRYAVPASDGGEPRLPELDEVRRTVENDYRRQKMQARYQELIESELAAADVELFAERLGDG